MEFQFPTDLADKGNNMVKAYYNLYCLENVLRLFVEKVAKDIYSEEYWDELKIKKEVQANIDSRKKQEKKDKWLSLRGDSNLFYLDFDDLRKIIISNWELFENHFPTQGWITNKLIELYKIRNRIAHMSYIKEIEQEVLETYAKVIYEQIGMKLNIQYPSEYIVKKFEPSYEEKDLFTEFQELIYRRNFKKILIDWNRFQTLFYTNAFHRPKGYNILLGSEKSIHYKFDQSAISISHDGPNFYCIITNSEGIRAKDDDENFDIIAKQFFENIKDGIRIY